MPIDPQETVDQIMRRWPATIAVFLRQRMRCIGCPVGHLHTVADAAHDHGLDPAPLLADLRAAASSDADRG
jgi:hybrid cluster-associated redox disulfide protein